VDGHGAGRRIDALDGLDEFLSKSLADQVVALLEELGGREAPFVAAAHEERVLGRRLDAPIDHHEPCVLAEFHAGDAANGRDRAAQAVVRKPLILRAVGHIDLESGDLNGGDAVAGREVLDRGDAAVGQTDERAKEQAVRTPATTTSASAAAPTPATTTTSSAAPSASAATRSAAARTTAAGAAGAAPARAASA
jgi:hypothetical protein